MLLARVPSATLSLGQVSRGVKISAGGDM
jgi:hypothetical protein